MARVRDTVLFKETKDYVHPISKRLYEKALTDAKQHGTNVSWDAPHIDMAFPWISSPQGKAYWRAMSEIIMFNQFRGKDHND